MDRDLVVQAQQGDQRAFESLAAANHARLFRVAQGILRDPHLAEDATQQAFLDIWRHIRRLRDPSKFEGWSYRLVVNACYDEAKRKPKWVPDSEMKPTDEPRAGDAFGAVADRDQLDRGFQHLSLDHRAILVLRYLLDMTLEQVAEALGIPEGTVHSRMTRAMEALRAALEADARPATPTEWMKDTEFPPPDSRRSAHQVATRLPQTHQLRRKWWLPSFGRTQASAPTTDDTTDIQPSPIPATNGHSPTVLGRTQSMFSPVKAITAGALVFAIGGAFLIAQPFDQQGTSVPGAATDEFIAPVEVSGASWSRSAGCTAGDYEGPNELAGGDAKLVTCSSTAGMPWSMSDPRLEGTVTRINEESYVEWQGRPRFYVASAAFSIENDGGSWRERPRTLVMPGGYLGYDTDWPVDETIVLDGDGDYQGLVAVLRGKDRLRDIRGFIMDARLLPPPPENASTE